ncbi:MAG TPA: insulinase family protein [Patescibacteria group bacterium]
MRDRQVFDENTLKNGIKTYTYKEDVPFTIVHLRIPVGSSHSTGDIIPGSFHFLEHLLMDRSETYSNFNEFNRLVGLKGGHVSAATGPFETKFTLSIPTKHFPSLSKGLLDQVFKPLFLEEDIALERGIIRNERTMKERWFPGSSEKGQYIATQWLNDCPLTLRQRLGNDEDLARMTPESLRKVHRYYSDPRMKVVIGGSGYLDPFFEELAALSTQEHSLTEHYKPVSWANREYHEKEFRDVSRHELYYGGISTPKPDINALGAIPFILNYLTNSIHGPLYRWLREEKGWVYNLGSSFYSDRYSADWTLTFPLGDKEQVETVRKELWERVRSALNDQDAINADIDRQLDYAKAYSFQRVSDILGFALNSLTIHERIIPESEMFAFAEKLRDRAFLVKIFEEHFAQEHMGTFLATPLTVPV